MYADPSASSTIYIRAVVDAAGALQLRPDAPSEDAAHSLSPDQLIVTTTAGAVEQGTVTFAARPGDLVRFYATSGSNNFEDAVLLAKVSALGDADIVDGLADVELSQATIVPAPQSAERTQAPVEQNFWFWQGAIAGQGSQRCRLLMSLYARDENTGQPRFAGLFRCDLQLTVQPSLPPEAEPQEQAS